MMRVVTYLVLFAAFCQPCWAQAASGGAQEQMIHAPSGLGFQRIGIYPTLNGTSTAIAGATPAAIANASPPYNYNGILYNGGLLLTSPAGANVYIIWYGNWPDGDTQSIVSAFVTGLGGSPYWNILSTYFDYNQQGELDWVQNRVTLRGSIIDHYSFGNVLTDNEVGLVIQRAVVSKTFPADPNGVYFVVVSGDVDESSGLCTLYCGFHGYQPVHGLKVNRGLCGDSTAGCLLGAFVGGQARCPNVCTWQGTVSGPAPNGNLVADGMVATVSHELAETVTDPWGNGWINPDGSEIADLCDGVLGALKILPNGENYNVTFGDRHYLVSDKWVNARGGYCGLYWKRP
jgi:hypothetical protein